MSLLKTGAVQVGQSDAASNNFHWRNLLDGILRLSRGDAGSPIADVIRVRADNSVGFPGGISGGFAKEYVSAEQAITLAGLITLTHGLGVAPKLVVVYAVCKVAEHGYSIGDVVAVPLGADTLGTAQGVGISVRINATELRVLVGNAQFMSLIHATSGAQVTPTTANWRLVVRAWA